MAYRYVIESQREKYLAHSGKKGMKWGYNDGQRNGRREAAELDELEKIKNKDGKKSEDFQGDYNEANNMLKYLGISLDLQSDNEAAAKTMDVYEEMRDSKDKYGSQYEWLSTLSKKLGDLGYDMAACDKYLAENKDKLNTLKTGTGSNNREDPYKDTKTDSKDKNKSTSKKTTSKSSKSTSKKSSDSKTDDKSKKESSNNKTTKEETKEETKAVVSTNNKAYEPDGKRKKKSELKHSGVRGMRWGVRRYQNPDGTLTEEGKKHYGYNGGIVSYDRRRMPESLVSQNKMQPVYTFDDDSSIKKPISTRAFDNIDKTKLVKGLATTAAIAGTAALTAYAIKNPAVRAKMAEVGKQTLSSVGKRTLKAGESAYDAAIATVGMIGVSKLAEHLEAKEGDSETTKNVKNVALNAGTAAIKTATASKNTNVNNSKGSSSNNELLKKTRDLKSEIGDPKGMHGYEDEKAYQGLFKRNPSDDQRAIIKAMRKNGYSVDQIENYVFHSAMPRYRIIRKHEIF